uniref:PIG-P domain-containing protein n=1 Tax=Ananas comosus var. bracteatus TaxID=296719 RepID=A0A6V7QVH0_ANACO
MEKSMEEGPSSPTSLVVSSPRRTMSLLRERRARVASSSASTSAAIAELQEKGLEETKMRGAAFAAEHGPKPSEVYGFVGSITTVIATVIFLVWAYIPERWLHSLGITYYPSKYWALAVPSFVIVAVVLGLVFYLGLNFMLTPPPNSFNTMFDDYSRERSMVMLAEGLEKPIEPISDIGIDQINNRMFG